MDTFQVNVHLVNDEVMQMTCASKTNAEELCLKVCRELKVAPTTLSLFALRVKSTGVFQPSNSIIDKDFNYELRIRFKVPDLQRLQTLDLNTYNYYFLQVKADVLANRIPEINLHSNKKHLLGLGVADMYRAMIEENKSFDEILNNYKKFIPKEVYNVHWIFIKKPIRKNLKQLRRAGHETQYVKVQYLEQIHMMTPNYLSEEFSAFYHMDKFPYKVRLFVAPFHEEQPGIRMHLKHKKEWVHICRIDELYFFSVKDDATVEIGRKNGVPFYLKFEKYLHALSFIGVCDGYYRLMVKWTFNLCNDVVTPSLHKLNSAKCHGPVGGEFSFRKLSERCDNRPGSYILRQCQQEYDVYYLDVCSEDSSKPVIHRIEFTGYSYVMSGFEYESFEKMRAAHQDPDAHIYMKDCLPPSEYDKSPLLLCVEPPKGPGSRVHQDELETLLAEYKNPHFIRTEDVQFYKATMVESTNGAMVTYRARWHIAPSKNLEVSFKLLKKEKTDEYLRDFKEQAGRWAYLRSNAIVSLYGLMLLSPCAMVMEYLPLGPLDEYLSANHDKMKVVDLVQAAATLGTALCELAEAGAVHGYIRCRKLLVAAHTEHHFEVKLSNPGLHSYQEDVDYHWLPPECYRNYNSAKTSAYADVWAFATTLWEIFSLGLSPAETNPILTKKSYRMGNRLCNPNKCSTEIYRVMLGCWQADPHKRLAAQGVMRDVNSQLHQVYNSRRKHKYERVCKEVTLTDAECVEELEMLPASLAEVRRVQAPDSPTLSFRDDPVDMNDISMQCIYEAGPNTSVVLNKKIGEGCYGVVYLGSLENHVDGITRTVAVKTIRDSKGLTDFLREIDIMQDLCHENVVKILCVLYDPEIQLVMEYIPHGSLQSYVQIYKNQITIRHLLKFAQDIANGMHYLGTKNIVHRDLAARNILVVNDHHVKISDFGLAQDTGLEDFYLTKTHNREMPLNGYAPESVFLRMFTHKSDVWSYGVILWEMFSWGRAPPPWDLPPQPVPPDLDLEAIGRNRSSCFSCPTGCPDKVYSELLWPCLNYKPQDRPAFASLATLANQLSATY